MMWLTSVLIYSLKKIISSFIYNLITTNLITTDKYPKYIPHITIAYVKKGMGKKFINDSTFNKLKEEVDVMHFSSYSGKMHIIKL